MPVSNRDTLKQWFETNDYPTQEQFANVFDSFVHKNDSLVIGNITGLGDALTTLSNLIQGAVLEIVGNFDSAFVKEIIIPADKIYSGILLINEGSVDCEFNIDLEVATVLSEYMPASVVPAGERLAEEQRLYGPCKLYITAISGVCNFKVFK